MMLAPPMKRKKGMVSEQFDLATVTKMMGQSAVPETKDVYDYVLKNAKIATEKTARFAVSKMLSDVPQSVLKTWCSTWTVTHNHATRIGTLREGLVTRKMNDLNRLKECCATAQQTFEEYFDFMLQQVFAETGKMDWKALETMIEDIMAGSSMMD